MLQFRYCTLTRLTAADSGQTQRTWGRQTHSDSADPHVLLWWKCPSPNCLLQNVVNSLIRCFGFCSPAEHEWLILPPNDGTFANSYPTFHLLQSWPNKAILKEKLPINFKDSTNQQQKDDVSSQVTSIPLLIQTPLTSAASQAEHSHIPARNTFTDS